MRGRHLPRQGGYLHNTRLAAGMMIFIDHSGLSVTTQDQKPAYLLIVGAFFEAIVCLESMFDLPPTVNES